MAGNESLGEYLTVRQVAQILSLSEQATYRRIYQGLIPHLRLSERTIRVRRADLDAWAAEQAEASTRRRAGVS
jgi:excisionase family DNA binding protein